VSFTIQPISHKFEWEAETLRQFLWQNWRQVKVTADSSFLSPRK